MEILLITACVVILVSWGIIWNLLTKNEKAEDMILERDVVIKQFYEVIDFTDQKLKQIDSSGTFASDDEVGFFFTKIKELQDILNKYAIK
jgi:hypothetical protein